jgi:hypothetical protein
MANYVKRPTISGLQRHAAKRPRADAGPLLGDGDRLPGERVAGLRHVKAAGLQCAQRGIRFGIFERR